MLDSETYSLTNYSDVVAVSTDELHFHRLAIRLDASAERTMISGNSVVSHRFSKLGHSTETSPVIGRACNITATESCIAVSMMANIGMLPRNRRPSCAVTRLLCSCYPLAVQLPCVGVQAHLGERTGALQ